MMLTVSMTVSHLYQILETLKVSEALKRLLKVFIIAINAQSHSVDSYYEQGLDSILQETFTTNILLSRLTAPGSPRMGK